MRARQSHLLDRYTSENASSASASKVVNDVSTAWTAYVHKYISKTPSDQADESNFAAAEAAWQGIEAQARDGPWLEAQKLADEKFSMHFAAVAAGYAALRPVREKAAAGSVAPEEATQVINANRDALGLWLDKQVRTLAETSRASRAELTPGLPAPVWCRDYGPGRLPRPRRVLGRRLL